MLYPTITESIHYHEANGPLKPDDISTAILVLQILKMLRAQVTLHRRSVDQGPLSKSTGYCHTLGSFSNKITKNQWQCIVLAQVHLKVQSTFFDFYNNIRGYKNSPGTESYLLASLTLSIELQSTK